MTLGLLYHVGLIYGITQEWRVLSDETSSFIQYASDFIHMFRMEAFYLISGFFYLLVFSKGRAGFMKDRIYRALIPMLFCGFLINPIMNYYSYNWNYDLCSSYYFISGQWLGHLWFLGNLIIYFLLSIPLCKFIIRSKGLSSNALLFLFLFIVPVFGMLGLAISKITYNERFLFVSFHELFYYYSYFVFGCVCFKSKESFLSLLNFKYSMLSLFVFLSVLSICYIDLFSNDVFNKILVKFSTGSLVLFSISFLYCLGGRDSRLIRSFSDSSYTVYLLHQPLIILFYIFVFERSGFSLVQNYLLMVLSVFFISYCFHVFFVKNNKMIKFIFNGVTYNKKS
jgi:membrane-bound acyltransferase YfiQ involved in biofilm formation